VLQLVPIAVTRLVTCDDHFPPCREIPRHLRSEKEAFRNGENTSRFFTIEISVPEVIPLVPGQNFMLPDARLLF